MSCIGFPTSRCAISTTITWCPEASHGRDAALLNLLRTKVRETETLAAQVFITRSFEVLRPDIFTGAEPSLQYGLRDDDFERGETSADGRPNSTTVGRRSHDH